MLAFTFSGWVGSDGTPLFCACFWEWLFAVPFPYPPEEPDAVVDFEDLYYLWVIAWSINGFSSS